jgi:hypothetical protein
MAAFFSSILDALTGASASPADALEPAPRANPAFVKRQRAPLSPVDAQIEGLASRMADATRDLQRHARKMAMEDAKGVRKARAFAQQGDMRAAADAARALVRTRVAQLRLGRACERMQALGNRLRIMQANTAVVACAKQSLAVLQTLNDVLSPAEVGRLKEGLKMETAKLNLAQEAIDEALDELDEADVDAAAADDDTLSEAHVLRVICDECNIDLAAALPSAERPHAAPAGVHVPHQSAAPELVPDGDESALAQRLAALHQRPSDPRT